MLKFDNTLNRLRLVGALEALSFLLLLGVAMPLKYIWGHHEFVRVAGMAHGILFLAYVGLALLGQADYKWSRKTTGLLLLASLLPCGPIVADAKILRQVEEQS